MDLNVLLAALAVAFVSGVVKGTVGFGMPMIMISGLTIFLAPDLALAALIIPTVITNVWQALRQGLRAAIQSVLAFRVFLLSGFVMLVLSAQLVRVLPQQVMYLLIGIPVAGFAILQLSKWRAQLATRSAKVEAGVGVLAGFMGGISGIWGPPTVAYLTAVNTPKTEQMRVQGTIYGLGAVALFGAHLQSGVLRAETLPISIMAVLPALAGMVVGLQLQDRIDQQLFRRITLFVLLIAGLNLIRRGMFG